MTGAPERANERVHIFGIRHHGPGSSRSLRAALECLQPDLLLIEGPPDANELIPLAINADMHPPVALLIYSPDQPGFAAYYPFAEYSPEWQAMRYALANHLPVRMNDLPQAVQMAMTWAQVEAEIHRVEESPPQLEPETPAQAGENEPAVDTAAEETLLDQPTLDFADPLRMLAEAAGYSESEQWWEHLVEQRREPGDVFTALLEAMTALRETLPPETDPSAIRREAAMRQGIRAALDEGYQRIGVICGAWHSPALVRLDDGAKDAALLKDLPKMPVCATWVPWTNARLTRKSGYGAGIDSPGWYGHLWTNEEQITTRWLIRVAKLLREEDLDISPAHVIEAVRLAETLAALRDRPLPGLLEMNEAALTVFCFGNPAPLSLIEDQLIVGDALGGVPPETPMAPLQQDLERETKRLKMMPEANEKILDLDVRRQIDLERSHLLHRLRLLGVPWGQNNGATLQAAGHGRGGTFHEIWRLKWLPEFAVLLIEAGQWGSTIAAASAERVRRAAEQAADLTALTELAEDVLLADLPEAIETVMHCLQSQAAVSSDMRHLIGALLPLTSVLRYGNVRQTDTAMIAGVVDGLAARVCIGLPGACISLDEDAAAEMFQLILKVDEAFNRLDEERYRLDWQHTLLILINLPNIHGLIAGRACRVLLDGGSIPHDEAARRLGLALSTAVEPLQAASWIEGFLRGSGQLLIHDGGLLGVVDGWLNGLPESIFSQLLPLLRRTFSTFPQPERRSIGERIKHGFRASETAVFDEETLPDFDLHRADAVLLLVTKLLGIPNAENGMQ